MTDGGDAGRAAERLIADKEDLARAITEALYAERPELTARYGAAGREKCLQDMRYNLEHLAPAVALSDNGLFVSYARWLVDMLGARGIPIDDVVRSLRLTDGVLARKFPAGEAEAAAAPVRAALIAIAPGPGQAT